MKLLSFTLFITLVFIFSGCSSKKYFEPKTTFSASSVSKSFGGDLIDLSRNGGTLDNGTYLGNSGLHSIELGKGYRFLNENKRYILAVNAEGLLKIIDKQTKEVVRIVSLHIPVVSATIHQNTIAYILNNNTFGIYQIDDNKKIVESRSEQTFAIDTRAASPMFIENLVVMPMLDGKLIIVNINDTENAKVVYISSEPAFNNVIYLSRMGNTMVAATPTRLITLGVAGKLEYTANISEVAIDDNRIYLFTKEGRILALDTHLKLVAMTKFKFAHYAVATAFDRKVYALDQQGSLIVLNHTLDKFKVYDVGKVNEPAFMSGRKLYKDGKVIELSKLGYE
jgi:hypothetical protein